MWIINKRKLQIFNTSAFSRLAISNKNVGEYLVLAVIDFSSSELRKIEMGSYTTAQKASGVIREIYKVLEHGANVYEMPVDDGELECEKK